MLKDEDFDYREEEGEPTSRGLASSGPTDERSRTQASRIQAAMSNHFLNTMIRRKGANASDDEGGDDEDDGSGRGERHSSATARGGGVLSGLIKQASRGTLISRFSASSSSAPALDLIKTVEMEVSDSHRQLVRAVASSSQRHLLPQAANDGPTDPSSTAAPGAAPTKVFTLWLVGRPGSGRKSLVAGLLFFLQRRLGLGSNETLVTHLQARFQEELPSASELSSPSSLLVVVFDVCDRTGLDAVARLPVPPCHKPLLVGNKIDAEYWRVIKVSHGESVAVLRGYDYHEASALTGLHVEDLLVAVDRRLRMVRALRLLDVDLPPDLADRLSDSNSSSSGGSSGSSLTCTEAEGEEEEDEEDEGSASLYSAASSSASLRDMQQQQQQQQGDDFEDTQASCPRSPSAAAFFDAIQESTLSPDSTPPPSPSPRRPAALSSSAAPLQQQQQQACDGGGDVMSTSRRSKQARQRDASPPRVPGPEAVDGGDHLFGPDGQEAELAGAVGVEGQDGPGKGRQASNQTRRGLASELHLGLLGCLATTTKAKGKGKEKEKEKEEAVAAPPGADDLSVTKKPSTAARSSSSPSSASGCRACGMCLGAGVKRLLNDVVADSEAACQALATLLARLLPAAGGRAAMLLWWPVGAVMAWSVTLACSLALLLPSFATLLLFLRPAKAKDASLLRRGSEPTTRWLVRVAVRSAPMAVVTLLVPVLLVYRWLPGAPPAHQTAMLVAYVTGLLLLQSLATARSFCAWRARELTIPPAPQVLTRQGQPPQQSDGQHTLLGWLVQRAPEPQPPARSGGGVLVLSQPPAVPGSFSLARVSGVVVLASLALESAHMAAFALQADPYAHTAASGIGGHGSSGLASKLLHLGPTSRGGQGSEFWGSRLFRVLFLSLVPAQQQHGHPLLSLWAAVVAVAALLLLVVALLTTELRTTGLLLQSRQEEQARESFAASLTGSILYGHGRPPKPPPAALRTVLWVLSDSLFLLVTTRLLTALSCGHSDYHTAPPRLLSDPSFTCWEGAHQPLACACLVALALYLPLAIMLVPMLTDQRPPQGPSSSDESRGVMSTARPHAMAVNVIKAALALTACLGPRTLWPTALATAAASSLLGFLTLAWFALFVPRHYSQELQPCNVALVNVWRAASFAAGVATAAVLIAAHLLGRARFPEASLLPILLIIWIGLALGFAAYYLRWRLATSDRDATIERLLALPYEYHAAVLESEMQPRPPVEGEEAAGKEEEEEEEEEGVLMGMGDYDAINKHGPPPAIPGYRCCPLCQHRTSAQGLVMM